MFGKKKVVEEVEAEESPKSSKKPALNTKESVESSSKRVVKKAPLPIEEKYKRGRWITVVFFILSVLLSYVFWLQSRPTP